MSSFSGTPESYSAKIERSPSQSALNMQKPASSAPNAAAAPQQVSKAPTKSKPRKRVNTAEKRNQHNAIERQRRETLNSKFLSLARLLPSLASHRRPSKSAIVNGSISHLTFQRDQRLMASRLLRQLCADRDALAKECNEWRAANGFPPKDSLTAWTEEMDEVCNVEKEVFGNFATMDDGDDDADQDGPEFGGNDFSAGEDAGHGLGLGFNGMNAHDMSLERAAAVAAANVNVNVAFDPMSGLITPRHSTDMDPLSHVFINNKGLPQLSQTHNLPQIQQTPGQQNEGINWADFSFVNNNNNGSHHDKPNPLATSTSSLPFSAFMSDSLSSSPSGCSPTGSAHTGTGIPTPPTTAELGSGFTHTPSPRSSSVVDDVVQGKAPQRWTEQQLLFLHSVQQQQLQQRQQAQASMLHQATQSHVQSLPQVQPTGQSFNPAVFTNSFSFGLNGNGNNNGNGNVNGNGDVMNLMASMFPQQSNVHVGNMPSVQPPQLQRAQTEQMDAWRRMTIANGMMRGVWEQGNSAAVKGF